MVGLDHFDSSRLQPLRPLFNIKLHFLAFFEGMLSLANDCRMVDKHIRSIILGQKTITFGVIEPFHRTDYTFRHFVILHYDF